MKYYFVGRRGGKRVVRWGRVVIYSLALLLIILFSVVLLVNFLPSDPKEKSSDLRLIFSVALVAALSVFVFVVREVRQVRAALREPLEPLPEIPPFGPRVRRWARNFLFCCTCLVTLLALFHAVENWRGRRAFEKFKREVEAQGDSLEARALIPPPVPDDENFAMHPFFKPLLDYDNGTKEHGVIWHDTNGYQRVMAFKLEWEHSKSNPMPSYGGVQSTDGIIHLIDLAAWQKYFRASTNYPHADQPQTPAQDVLLALSKFGREFKDLEEAARRPRSRFPVHYDDINVFGILLPHLSVMKSESSILNLRAAAQLAAGQTGDAFTTVKIAFKISDSIKDEPTLIAYLVRIASLSVTLKSVAEGLAAHRWNEAQLLELEKRLSEIDLLAEYQHAMRSERNLFSLGGMDYLKTRPPEAAAIFELPDESGSANDNNAALVLFTRTIGRIIVPDGWFDQNKCVVGNIIQNHVLTLADAPSHRIYPDRVKKYENEIVALRHTPYSFIARLLLPVLNMPVLRAGRLQTNVDEARLACALERYRMANGQFPETLDALVPKFVAKLPPDVITGTPLKYRREADGQFVLYSVGLDEVDDGGGTVFKKGLKAPTTDPERGDWVWKYPAKN